MLLSHHALPPKGRLRHGGYEGVGGADGGLGVEYGVLGEHGGGSGRGDGGTGKSLSIIKPCTPLHYFSLIYSFLVMIKSALF